MSVDRNKITRTILGLLAISALFAVAAIAPNCLQLLRFTGLGKKKSQRTYYINRAVAKLQRRGLVTFQANAQGLKCARLTAKGQAELARYRLDDLKIKKPRRWDGQYHLVIFDIKEWKRGIRNEVRHWLEHLGFVRLQNSVWVYPYQCQEVVTLLKPHFHIGREVLYLTVDSIEDDRWLKKEFNLA